MLNYERPVHKNDEWTDTKLSGNVSSILRVARSQTHTLGAHSHVHARLDLQLVYRLLRSG